MTDQIRRCSRSVCANLGEAWRKHCYNPAFIPILSDSETEAGEVQIWLEFALRYKYIEEKFQERLHDDNDHIPGQIVRMIDEPDKWPIRSRQ